MKVHNFLHTVISALTKKYIRRPVAAVEFSRPVWQVLNRDARLRYKANSVALDTLQERIVEDVRRDGVSIAHIEDLFADEPHIYEAILEELPKLIEGAVQDPKKIHTKDLWNTRSFELNPASGFVQYALSDRIINMANAYFGMWTRLLLGNGYLTDPNPDRERIGTQNWHRDAHDIQLFSSFLYLTDVNGEEDGAFWYAKRSHPFGEFSTLEPQRKPYSVRPPLVSQATVEAAIRPEDRKLCLGRKGTIIFADATGLHQGGYCTAHRRIMFLADYCSGHRFSKYRRVAYPKDLVALRKMLSPQGLYAAGLE